MNRIYAISSVCGWIILFMTDGYIIERPNGWHSLIDGKNFLRTKLADKSTCRLQAESHVRTLLQQQDGGIRQTRTLAERRNIYSATTCP